MNKITLKIDGIMCELCEKHINNAINKKFLVDKVTSSYKRGQTVIYTNEDITEFEILRIMDVTGYKLLSYDIEKCKVKKGIFSNSFI